MCWVLILLCMMVMLPVWATTGAVWSWSIELFHHTGQALFLSDRCSLVEQGIWCRRWWSGTTWLQEGMSFWVDNGVLRSYAMEAVVRDGVLFGRPFDAWLAGRVRLQPNGFAYLVQTSDKRVILHTQTWAIRTRETHSITDIRDIVLDGWNGSDWVVRFVYRDREEIWRGGMHLSGSLGRTSNAPLGYWLRMSGQSMLFLPWHQPKTVQGEVTRLQYRDGLWTYRSAAWWMVLGQEGLGTFDAIDQAMGGSLRLQRAWQDRYYIWGLIVGPFSWVVSRYYQAPHRAVITASGDSHSIIVNNRVYSWSDGAYLFSSLPFGFWGRFGWGVRRSDGFHTIWVDGRERLIVNGNGAQSRVEIIGIDDWYEVAQQSHSDTYRLDYAVGYEWRWRVFLSWQDLGEWFRDVITPARNQGIRRGSWASFVFVKNQDDRWSLRSVSQTVGSWTALRDIQWYQGRPTFLARNTRDERELRWGTSMIHRHNDIRLYPSLPSSFFPVFSVRDAGSSTWRQLSWGLVPQRVITGMVRSGVHVWEMTHGATTRLVLWWGTRQDRALFQDFWFGLEHEYRLLVGRVLDARFGTTLSGAQRMALIAALRNLRDTERHAIKLLLIEAMIDHVSGRR